MKLMLPSGIVGRIAAGLLGSLALVVGICPPAAVAEEPRPAPTIVSLHLEAPLAHVTFRGNGSEIAALIMLRERDRPDRLVAEKSVRPVRGAEAGVTVPVEGIEPGVAYCATVRAFFAGEVTVLTLPIDMYDPSPDSTPLCADPAVQAEAAPDLTMMGVRGAEERQWALVKDQSPAYLVEIRNEGADATGNVVVDLDTSGVATLANDQAVVRPGWAANGFTCTAKPPAGSTTGGLHCTGGSLKKGQSINPGLLLRFTRPGFGHVHAAVSVNGKPAEVDTRDNAQTLNIRIYE